MFNTAEKLKQARKNTGLTQDEVAEKTGFNKKTVSNWETGASRPDIDSVAVLLRLYNIDANSFYGWNERPKKADIESDLTEEEIKELERYKQFLISKRDK